MSVTSPSMIDFQWQLSLTFLTSLLSFRTEISWYTLQSSSVFIPHMPSFMNPALELAHPAAVGMRGTAQATDAQLLISVLFVVEHAQCVVHRQSYP
jgi:hypothetical protein